jgi:hypothetical protein
VLLRLRHPPIHTMDEKQVTFHKEKGRHTTELSNI